MWRIPLSVSERIVPHVAENFEEFEIFLKFFQQLDANDEENWWVKVDAASLDSLTEEERAPYGNDDESDEVVWEDSYDADYMRMGDGDVVDPNDFVAWLVTQPNAKGTLYLERVARHYVSFLRNTPYKLNVPLNIEECNIFACETVEDFDRICTIMTNAPNYKEVNNRDHNSFSAGMKCYGRYLIYRSTGAVPAAERLGRKPTQSPNHGEVSKPSVSISSEEHTAIEMVLETRYTNGFRIDLIELGRLRKFVHEITGADIALSDDELTEAVKTRGTLFEGKVYTVSKEARMKIKEVIGDYFNSGARVIFYEEFYSKNESWLFDESLVSVDMLIDLVRRLFPKLEFTETFFGYTRASIPTTITTELHRVWGDDVLLSYSQMSERLPYVPIWRIKSALSYNPDYIWNSVEVFASRSNIDVSPAEKNNVRDVARRECELHRYVSVMDLPLENLAERNHELSQTAVHNAAFSVYLADEYEKRGKIIMRKGESVDALTIMREYCRTLNRVTLGELLEFERDLTGESHRWLPMQAGYDIMVRIDKDTYIADRFVDFDVDGIDAALDHFVHGQYAPLITVTTFAIFPHCGQTWNLFLLESYVRRFSRHFRFESPSVNNRNVGCIVQRYSRLDYDGIMIDAIANSSLTLHDESAVANFLFDNGYRGSRQKAKLVELIKQAIRQRERRD